MNQTYPQTSSPNPEMEKQNVTYPRSKREEDQAAKKSVEGTKSSVFNMHKNARTPNVFTTSPRPGGYLRTLVPSNTVDQAHINTSLDIIYHPPKPTDQSMLFDAFKSLSEKEEKMRLDSEDVSLDTSTRSEKSTETEGWTSLQNSPEDCSFVLSVVISTLMALAANCGNRIPPHHVMWTVNFLSTIKDDENKTPTNLVGIKKLLRPLIENLPETSNLMDDFAADETQVDRTPRSSTVKRLDDQESRKGSSARPKSAVTSTPMPPRTKRMPSRTSEDSVGRVTPRKSSWK